MEVPFFALQPGTNIILGKYVPSITYKIHSENLLDNPGVPINFQGFAVGNGAFAPEDQWIYGDYLYEVMSHD